MPLLYSLLYTLAFLALLPYFAYQAIFNRKYLGNLSGRLWVKTDSLKKDARPAIWLHAVSVGETLAAKTLIGELCERFPNHRLVISTTTLTGQAVARDHLCEADEICYFPFDWKFTVRRALNAIQPQIVILMESELWLNFLCECKVRQIPAIVVNGRISDRSFPRSQKFGFFVHRLYSLVTAFLMQSPIDADRAMKLGAPSERVSVTGNLKYDIGDTSQSAKSAEKAKELDQMFALGHAPLIVAGSTSEGEERILLDAFVRLQNRSEFKNVRLMIAPRHPERFDNVARLLEAAKLNFVKRSVNSPSAQNAEVVLLDSVGELGSVYRFASLVFVGGSLVPVGGHNILEPALFAKPIIVGPYMQNFRQIAQDFLQHDALIQIRQTEESKQASELDQIFTELLTNENRARQLGENARLAMDKNRGATERTIYAIASIIETSKGS